MDELGARMRNAWEGRISGCMLGKAVERFSMRQGQPALVRRRHQVRSEARAARDAGRDQGDQGSREDGPHQEGQPALYPARHGGGVADRV